MDSADQSSWHRLPDPGEPPASTGPGGRDRGIRHVQRTSNVVAAALVLATFGAASYFAHATVGSEPSATSVTGPGVTGPGVTGTGVTGTQVKPGARPGTPSAGQPCVTTPVATSGGSGVTTTAPAPNCAPSGNGANGASTANGSNSAPGVAHFANSGEGQDG